MTKIIYIVHSTTGDNEKGIVSGQYDCPLSERGINQAKNLFQDLSKIVLDFGEIYCSPLSRAVQTAAILFPQKNITSDKRLMEINYGSLTQNPVAIIEKIRSKYIDEPMPEGESYQDVKNRIQSFLDDHQDKDSITIISHQATQLALEVLCNNKDWPTAFSTDWREKKQWQPYWIYHYTKK